ncbi:MAG: hypothetical protein QM723_32045 [Myxococcaceae bacterium]
MRLTLLLAGSLAVLTACKKDPPPLESLKAVADPKVPPAVLSKEQKELNAAFIVDCHHVVTVTVDGPQGDEQKPECEARDFDQNCSPDMFGCWDGLQKCKDACSKPCGKCQSDCADSCDGCKAKCSGDVDCISRCGVARLTCRTTCLASLNTCRDTTCEAESKTCEEKAEAQLKKDCPDCEGLRTCLTEAMEKGVTDYKATQDGCLKKFPKADRKCVELCDPGP